MGIMLDALYAAGLVAASPVWLYRMVRHGRYRRDIRQRFGASPRRYGLQPTIWVHGVSLGEINAARALVRELHSQLPDFRVVVSSTTDTGMSAARKHFGADYMVFRWPLDFTFSVRKALGRVRPSLVVLIEGEIWPNFLAACNRRDIPVVVVNGRMSPDKGYPRYRKLGRFAGRLFNRLTAIGVQDEIYAERFRSLGADPDRLYMTGMMKFDGVEVAGRVEGQDDLAAAVGVRPDDKLIVAGGTGGGEEEMLLDVFTEVKGKHASARLAVVPRKPERFEEVARLIRRRGYSLTRRSEHPDGSRPPEETGAIILGDTMGELRKFYALAECVFVGRSLVPMGGSDMIESAALGKPTAFGPHTYNFPQADALAENGCARVFDAGELKFTFEHWFSNREAAVSAGREAQEHVRLQQGATRRNVDMICRVLGRTPAVAPGAVATDQLVAPREDA